MTTRRKKELERLSGVGIIYQKENPIAKAQYSFVVTQDVLISNTFGGTSQIDGLKSADGTLRVVEGEKWLMDIDDALVLELEDGRSMEFLVRKYDLPTNRYQVVRTGDWLESG